MVKDSRAGLALRLVLAVQALTGVNDRVKAFREMPGASPRI
jgi:hypothetical protein